MAGCIIIMGEHTEITDWRSWEYMDVRSTVREPE